ncbi:M61 family metallopeptidase [Dyella sp. 7MK23]|uniref:M61 family metallopeptidase n=1 Tax=Dyella acidiphila TaxID=2775866 RepID=A0ABR9G4U7_9GAMM|nr:M61 family metallopeptidase [Dyella acidiphila]
MGLDVQAVDTDHQVFSVHETIPVQQAGDTVLLYPQWETASHAPTASIADLAGLVVQVDGARIDWTRDPVNMYAFHLDVPKGAHTITLDFQFLAAANANLLRPEMVVVPWQRVLLYPAGWYVRDLPVAATLVLPPALTPFTSLAFTRSDDRTLHFQPVSLEQLVDAPVYAGSHARRIVLDPQAAQPVALDLLADHASDLAMSPAEVAHMQALLAQTLQTFGAAPYRHYDAIISLSDVLSPGGGTEHLQEGENNLPAGYADDPASQLNNRDLIAHELVHAWNGRAHEPADLWSPTYNQPVGGSLLWVYEGQTEFWGRVLAARAGLRNTQETLDKLALDAALVAHHSGRAWKNLQDSTNDAIYMAGHRVAWRDWQRREDYYPEGVLLWLDVDAHLRELSHDARGLDDFARRFFASPAGGLLTQTYRFEDICSNLNTLAADDWAQFLQRHLRSHDERDALAGLARAGWKLIYTEVPTETFRQDEAEAGVSNLDYSIGLQIDERGRVASVAWDGPAFRAGLAPGARVTAVNGQAFTIPALLAAVQASASKPVRLQVTKDDNAHELSIPYQGSLQYPHLERIAGTVDRLLPLLQAR